VTVSDGQLTAKTEVYVNIESASAPNRGKTRYVITRTRVRVGIFNRSMKFMFIEKEKQNYAEPEMLNFKEGIYRKVLYIYKYI